MCISRTFCLLVMQLPVFVCQRESEEVSCLVEVQTVLYGTLYVLGMDVWSLEAATIHLRSLCRECNPERHAGNIRLQPREVIRAGGIVRRGHSRYRLEQRRDSPRSCW